CFVRYGQAEEDMEAISSISEVGILTKEEEEVG
ncbi:hypothetical protein A2U01_0089225, partial [Trifolium medium]|nr:hypothetical protein [Trifolium medium]